MSMESFRPVPVYEDSTRLGFIAHMDTVSDFADHPVVPVIHPEYDGEDLALGTSGRTLENSVFPHLSGAERDVR